MKRGALDTEVVMFVNDLRERCGSGRLGSSCHVIGIIDEIHKKVGKGFAGNSVKLAQCRADILHGSHEALRNGWLAARGFHDGPGAKASTDRPDVRVQPTGTSHDARFGSTFGPGEFRGIFSETLTRSKKSIYAG
jgi:hypothetical protein